MLSVSAIQYLQKFEQSLPGLGLGTTRLPHYFSSQEALYDLDFAFDEGITYFDTAPIYGFGWSEKLIGKFSRNKRSKMLLATKAGLQPSSVLSRIPFQAHFFLRKGKKVRNLFSNPRASISPVGVSKPILDEKYLRNSLEQSLKRLKTDYIDFLLLHEASFEEANSSEICSFIHEAITQGKIRYAGIGSSAEKISSEVILDPVYNIIQTPVLENNPLVVPDDERVFNVHGVHGLTSLLKTVRNDTALADEIFIKTELDINRSEDIRIIAFSMAAHQAKNGMVLTASSQRKHLQENLVAWRKSKSLSSDSHSFFSSINLNKA